MKEAAHNAFDNLRPQRPQRLTSAEQTADVLREAIATGLLVPGMKLQEEALTASLGVARNTLRESFKTLLHEGLLVHEINRGVSVAPVTIQGIRDVYGLRKLLEVNAIRYCPPDADLGAVRAAVEDYRKKAEEGDWVGVGTANVAYHRAIVALAGSPRQDRIMRLLMAETRLHVSSWGDPRMWHEPFVTRIREVFSALDGGDREKAAELMEEHLREACKYVVEQHERAAKDREVAV